MSALARWFNANRFNVVGYDKTATKLTDSLLEEGIIVLLVSAISCAEVLNHSPDSQSRTAFGEFVKRDNVISAAADFRIANSAATIREKALAAHANGGKNGKLETPDALIIATANCYRAASLHSFDKVVLSFSGTETVDGLNITEPTTGEEYELF